MELYILTGILFLTQLGDWYSTRTILNKGGIEQNPIAKRLMEIFTMDGFLFVKTVGVTAIGYWVGSQMWFALVGIIVFYCFILMHNWKSMPASGR